MNVIGFYTLLRKELDRSRQVMLQAILSPTITTVLYFVVFGAAIGGRIEPVPGVSYDQFIVPGLIMMSLLMNSLMASSSGIYFPRFVGTISDLLSAPMSFLEITLGYALAATLRALLVGILIFLSALLFTPVPVAHIFFVILFAFLTSFTFSLLGLIIGIWAKDFEQLSFFPTLIIMPMSFLGGIFYSVDMLPTAWQKVTLINPVFYMIDGFRYGFFNVSHINPMISLLTVSTLLIAGGVTLFFMFRSGYKIKT